MDKAALRLALAQARKRLSPAEVREKSARIQAQLLGDPLFQGAHNVGLYRAFGAEVHTELLHQEALRAAKRVGYPEVLADGVSMRFVLVGEDAQWQPGRMGFEVPASSDTVPLGELDLIVLPGLGFDRAGRRLGRGGGHYDRLLAQPHRARLVGLGYDLQIVEALPADPWDVPLDAVVTESAILRAPRPPDR